MINETKKQIRIAVRWPPDCELCLDPAVDALFGDQNAEELHNSTAKSRLIFSF